ADGLPRFGIDAGVLGLVVIMEYVSGPVEEIGHHVGAALLGTFLGILAFYGFIAPLVVKREFQGINEPIFFRSFAKVVTGYLDDVPPKVAIEVARRSLPPDVRPTAEELEALFKEVDTSNA